jgi:four helix bundle protein
MATLTRFEELEAWQKARELTRAVYELARSHGFHDDRALRSQISRAAVSVMSNIAEGFEREGNAEFIQFLSIAKGSAAEVEAQLYVALDQGYVTQEQFDRVRALADSTRALIGGLMAYLKSSEMRGRKFK